MDGKKHRMSVLCCLLVCLFVCTDFFCITGSVGSADHFRIYTKGKPRHYAAIEGDAITGIQQDFYVQKPFNRISLPAKCKEDTAKVSRYRISLSDGDNILYTKKIGERSVKNNRIRLIFDPVIPEGHYTLHIEKLRPKEADITFFKKYDSYYIDAYDGELTVDGRGGYVNDLGLTVLLHADEEPYLPIAIRFALTGMLMFLIALAAWGNGQKDHLLET